MDPHLQAIADAMNPDHRDLDHARQLAATYIDRHPDMFLVLDQMSLDQCVQALSVFRAEGHVEDMWRVEAWLLHAHPPGTVSGEIDMELELPGFG